MEPFSLTEDNLTFRDVLEKIVFNLWKSFKGQIQLCFKIGTEISPNTKIITNSTKMRKSIIKDRKCENKVMKKANQRRNSEAAVTRNRDRKYEKLYLKDEKQLLKKIPAMVTSRKM